MNLFHYFFDVWNSAVLSIFEKVNFIWDGFDFNPNIDKHKIISMKVKFYLNFYFLPENSRISKKFVVRTKSCHYFHTFLLRYIFVVSILLSNGSACFSFQIIFVSFSCSTHLFTIQQNFVFSLFFYLLFRNLWCY